MTQRLELGPGPEPEPAPPTPRRMTLPDGLRAVAALMVVAQHSVYLFNYWPNPSQFTRAAIEICLLGHLGVQVFFVLSGFVIASSLPGDRLTPSGFANFMLRRSVRLDPPYWGAIALVYAFAAVRGIVGHETVAFPSGQALLAHLFYLQDLLGYPSISNVFWTLCIEVQFYLVFGLLLGLIRVVAAATGCRFRSVATDLLLAVLFLGSLAWPAGRLDITPPIAGTFLPHWHAFLAGAISWWAIAGVVPRWFGPAVVILLLAIGWGRPSVGCPVVAGTAALLLAAADRGNLYHWLNVGPLQFLGRLSYSIYLVHIPVIGLVIALQVRLAPRQETVSYLLLGLVYLGTISVAWPFHRGIELPALRLSRRLKRAAGGPAASGRDSVTGLVVSGRQR